MRVGPKKNQVRDEVKNPLSWSCAAPLTFSNVDETVEPTEEEHPNLVT